MCSRDEIEASPEMDISVTLDSNVWAAKWSQTSAQSVLSSCSLNVVKTWVWFLWIFKSSRVLICNKAWLDFVQGCAILWCGFGDCLIYGWLSKLILSHWVFVGNCHLSCCQMLPAASAAHDLPVRENGMPHELSPGWGHVCLPLFLLWHFIILNLW